VHRKRLQEQCKLVLEENELLMNQLDMQQQKHKEQQKMHAQEGMKFTSDSFGELFLFHIVPLTCFIVTEAGHLEYVGHLMSVNIFC